MKDYKLHNLFPLCELMSRSDIIRQLDRMISAARNYALMYKHAYNPERCKIHMNRAMYLRFKEVCYGDYMHDFGCNPIKTMYDRIQVVLDDRLVPTGDGQILITYAMEDIKMGPDGWNGVVKFDLSTTPIFIEKKPEIEKVIFNNPATIVIWNDGTKTVVKAQEGDEWDEEKGLAMAICKKLIGLKDFYKAYDPAFDKYIENLEPESPLEKFNRAIKIMGGKE